MLPSYSQDIEVPDKGIHSVNVKYGDLIANVAIIGSVFNKNEVTIFITGPDGVVSRTTVAIK